MSRTPPPGASLAATPRRRSTAPDPRPRLRTDTCPAAVPGPLRAGRTDGHRTAFLRSRGRLAGGATVDRAAAILLPAFAVVAGGTRRATSHLCLFDGRLAIPADRRVAHGGSP